MEKQYKAGKDIFLTALRTIIVLVGIVVVFSLCFFVINPYVSAKVCSALGFKNLEASCYELIYIRTKNNSDLYNLVVKLGGINKYAKQSKYIELLKNDANYGDFCAEADQSFAEAYNNNQISAKSLAKLYGTNEYLASTHAINYILLNNYDEAYNVIVSTKQAASGAAFTDRDYELAVYYYVDYLYSSAVTNSNCKNYCQKLASTTDGNMIAYLIERQASNELLLSSATEGSYQKIVALYAKVKITYSKFVLYKMTEQAELANNSYAEWQSAVAEYNAATVN
ncbi:MAG: hypothetical protein IJ542_02240 [Clostridia bacterium]|nr:hypothetical protein [Clostridia bacterium]